MPPSLPISLGIPTGGERPWLHAVARGRQRQKKTMQLRCPSKTLCDSCKTPPNLNFALRTFFFNEGTKILHKNCLPVSSYIVTFVSPNKPLNFTYDEF